MTPGGIFVRGMLMGAADVVPGVSGGTMAFITGIYDRLLAAIRAFDLTALQLLFKRDLRALWQHVDGSFLLALVAGIVTSVVSLARLLSWLLEHHPVPLWAFFFGLILASALILLRQVPGWSAPRLLALLGGVAIALTIGLSPVLNLDVGLGVVFVAGFIAICAMILPGISGSFILVLLGMYGTVLSALKGFDLIFLLVLASGAACGLLVFSRLLHWLLQRFHGATLATLTGFLFGSLVVVWPWKQVLDWTVSSSGEPRPAQQVPVLPVDYLVATGNDPRVALCLLVMFLGFVCVWFVDWRWGKVGLKSDDADPIGSGR